MTGTRLCPACGVAQSIATDEPLWPQAWRCASCGYAIPFADGIAVCAPALANSLTGFNPALFAELARREDGHFWFEPRNRLLVGLANQYFPEARRYLEIGCGTGTVLAAMADARTWAHLVGAEIHPEGLIHARRRLGVRAELVQLDAHDIPAREAFDLVGAFDVLEHIAEDERVLRQVHAALVPSGGLLAAVPQHPALWSQVDIIGHHVRRYRRGELERKLRAAGFDVLFSTSYASFVLPLMLASRLTAERTAQHEMALPPTINAILRSLLNAEVRLTLRGLAWPIGGSRVVVARKPLVAK